MTYPANLKYSKDHEWVLIEGDKARIGITAYALEQLGDVVFLELPEEGDSFDAGVSFGTIESTKTVSDLYMPVSGKVTAVNNDIADDLEGLAASPYDKGWLITASIGSLPDDLMDAAGYESYIKEQE